LCNDLRAKLQTALNEGMTLMENVQQLESEKAGLISEREALRATIQAQEYEAADAQAQLGSLSGAVESLSQNLDSVLEQQKVFFADTCCANEAKRHLEQLLLSERVRAGELEQSLLESSQAARDAAAECSEFSTQVQNLWDAKVALERKVRSLIVIISHNLLLVQ
jgi:chromosome segregation ATPase